MADILNGINHVLKNNREKVTSYYGKRSFTFKGKKYNDFHYGIDLICSKNKTDYVIAYHNGKIKKTRNSVKGYSEKYSEGNYVLIDHSNNYQTRYYHLKQNSICVKEGQMVKKGQIIGYIGNTGFVTGSHLHFEIRKNNQALNPIDYLLKLNINNNSKTNKFYTIKKGDTLWSIALKFYNDGSKYKEIAKVNKIKNPNKIYCNQRIIIP